ncbi:hypothetical protein [Xanthocytophaga agilis]|uniref:Uncharacterized protein n=1 Tax=Xanthocytophaga agilis TaxID=3048010 RepID=A0AAE3R478_9BACT|nr:hypothetical protein [Xanthocytophaga agilis]MDJ1501244.1 hypothetical protein [Xanthocytophaga agilis]
MSRVNPIQQDTCLLILNTFFINGVSLEREDWMKTVSTEAIVISVCSFQKPCWHKIYEKLARELVIERHLETLLYLSYRHLEYPAYCDLSNQVSKPSLSYPGSFFRRDSTMIGQRK